MHRLPHQLRRLPEHARAGRDPGHERVRLCRRAQVRDPVTRYPGLVVAVAWSAALAAAVVLLPARPMVGVVAIAAAMPVAALAALLRPALLCLALAAALLGVGRAELPAADPLLPARAASLAGSVVAITGQVVDDGRPVGGALPAPHAAMLLGIVLGVRQGIPAALENALIATGLVHLLVLSGLKVAVFARMVQGVLAPILGRLATWPALALIGLYALAGGATPAAIRASAMGGLAI